MPGNILNADTGFPQFTGEEKDSEKIEKISSYLYMLLEQLRYTMSNLGAENFNETELNNITSPIYAAIEDEAGNIAELQVEANNIKSTVQSQSTELEDVAESVSEVKQYAESITLSVENNADNTASTIKLLANNAQITSQVINLSGLVKITSLSDPTSSTTINGGLIKTGTLSGDRISGGTITGTTISGGTITGNTITGGSISGTSISGGTISSTTTINGSTINGSTINSANIYASNIYAVKNSDADYIKMTAEGLEVYLDADSSDDEPVRKVLIGQNPGRNTSAPSVILGADLPAYMTKYFVSGEGNVFWVGNNTQDCGVMFNFTNKTYKFYGTNNT